MIAPTITRPYRYPERDVEGAVPYEGERTRRKKGKCGAMGEVGAIHESPAGG